MPLSEYIRRVVTTLDASSKAVVLFDGNDPHRVERAEAAVVSHLIWLTNQTPAEISDTADRAAITIGIPPPPGGSAFRIVDFGPMPAAVEQLPPDTLHKEIGAHAPKKGRPPRHPVMHRTRTIDYAIIMEGEIDMLLDEGEIHLKVGDVVVQQGTNHAWVNRGTKPCRIAFVLIDAKEP